MKNLKEIFDPRITNPHKDHSIVFKVNNKLNLTLNIYYMSTDTDVG